MTEKVEIGTNDRFDAWKWAIVWLLLAAGIGGFYYFSEIMLAARVVGLLLVGGGAVWVASLTEKGRLALGFTRESHIEVRKVVWPTRQETLQVTGIVVVVVILMSFMIWAIDSFLFWIVQELTS